MKSFVSLVLLSAVAPSCYALPYSSATPPGPSTSHHSGTPDNSGSSYSSESSYSSASSYQSSTSSSGSVAPPNAGTSSGAGSPSGSWTPSNPDTSSNSGTPSSSGSPYVSGTPSSSGQPSSTSGPSSISDGDIVNFALFLEHLELEFYQQGLQNYSKADFNASGFDETFYNRLVEVKADETTHVSFLTSTLQAVNIDPVQKCEYTFGSTTPKEFVAVAAVLEGVGTTAYLGASTVISNKTYLGAAGRILTIESRHNTYIRAELGEEPAPQFFDVAQTFNQVYSLAIQMVKSCPSSNPPLPFKAYPPLTLTPNGPVKSGSTVKLVVSKCQDKKYPEKVTCAWTSPTGPIFVPAEFESASKSATCKVPSGIYGQSYVILTTGEGPVTDDTTFAGPAIVEILGTSGANSNSGSNKSSGGS